jgi:Peptidase family M23
VAACVFVVLLVLPGAIAHAAWRWPVRGPVVGAFRVTPRAPYARGQRRGIDLAAAPGSAVRAACAGRVTFTGALPRLGLAISVRCGALVATYLRLSRVVVRHGAVVAPGQPLGTVGPAGALRLGARRAADRRGYLDPLTLLHDPGPSPPALGPAPRPRRSRRPRGPRPVRPRPARPRPLPAPAPRPLPRRTAPPAAATTQRLPWPAYPALALVATALPVGGLLRRRRRRAEVLGSAAPAPSDAASGAHRRRPSAL